jgi:hypothetical protein
MLALFVALGGTGYAALKLPKNSVGAKQIKRNAINSAKVRNRSLKVVDFGAGQLPAGRRGPQGQRGANGTNGTQGPPGTFGAVTVQFTQAAADLGNGAETSIDAQCPAGQVGIGGGVRGDLTNSELTKVTASRPIISSSNSGAPADDGTFTGWRGTFVNENNGAGIRPETWVVCATPAP